MAKWINKLFGIRNYEDSEEYKAMVAEHKIKQEEYLDEFKEEINEIIDDMNDYFNHKGNKKEE